MEIEAEVVHTDKSEEKEAKVNLASFTVLKPAKLLTIKVKIGDTEAVALIDTGATNNLITESLQKDLKLKRTRTNNSAIVGLGMSKIPTMGRVSVDLNMYDIQAYGTPCCVVKDNVIEEDMILGRKFCEANNLILDLARRRISKSYPDNSRVDFYHDKNNKLSKIIYEHQPVYVDQETVISQEITEVPIQVKFLQEHEDTEMYYEGKCADKKLSGVDGILDSHDNHPTVWLQTRSKTKKRKVRKGQVIGRVSTLVEVDCANTNKNEQWTKEELKKVLKIGEDLTQEERAQVYEVLLKSGEALGKDSSDIGMINVKPHEIKLTDYTPIWQKPRTFSEPINQEIDRQCKELEALDIIEKSYSQWSSPIVPVRKPDGTLRMCVDYRKVNKVTKTEHFPMPNVNDAIYTGSKIKYFTKLDLIKGYYQLPIDENSREFTSFSTPHSQFQFKRLSFGLKNSGIEFQRTMTDILSEFDHRKVIVYIDDILILSTSFSDHIRLVEKVLNTLARYGITINIKKCEFFASKVNFLGHTISCNGIGKSEDFIEKIRNHPKPTTVTQMRQFLGLANFQRKFIPEFAAITKPLSVLTGGPKKQPIVWTEEMDQAFEIIKEKLMEEVSLSYPDFGEDANPLDLFVNASGTGVGACLMQLQGEEHKPIAYASKAFSSTEKRYSTTERELLAIRFGIQSFKTFLFGTKFNIHTDHKPLIFMMRHPDPTSRL